MISFIVLVLFVSVIVLSLCFLLTLWHVTHIIRSSLMAEFLILVSYLPVVISWLNYLYQLKTVGKCLSFPHLPSAIIFYNPQLCVGTDTVGCVRTPASFCGILGFRPSHGSVSSVGILANSQSLDTVGKAASLFFFYKSCYQKKKKKPYVDYCSSSLGYGQVKFLLLLFYCLYFFCYYNCLDLSTIFLVLPFFAFSAHQI